ncbi:ABC transporter, permease protein [Bifidobacterium gallicum DSM 20093 = LMG 11596]|nr:ABC transporter, permease protein [Bifidobacterium gallicum DSM 20093 = LMG 11596]
MTLSAADTDAFPLQMAHAFTRLVSSGILLPAMGASVLRVLMGLLLGIAVAVPFAVATGMSRWGRRVLDPPIHMLRAIPFPALAPILIMLIGIDEGMKVVLIAIGAFALIYVNVRDAIAGIDPKLIEVAHTYGLPRRTVIGRIIIPGTLPGFMTGLRFATTVAWIALVTCETINCQQGLGYVLSRAQQFSRMDEMAVCILIYALLGLACEAIVTFAERVVLVWR